MILKKKTHTQMKPLFHLKSLTNLKYIKYIIIISLNAFFNKKKIKISKLPKRRKKKHKVKKENFTILQ